MINWVNCTSKQRWQIPLGQVLTFGLQGANTSAVQTSVYDVAFDSSSIYSLLPQSDYTSLMSNIVRTKDVNCTTEKSGITFCNCTNVTDPKFYNISFRTANRYIFYLNTTEYLIYNTTRKQCLMTFRENPNPTLKYWIFGQAFMKSYYIIHDVSNFTMGFAGKFIDMGPPIPTANYTEVITVGQEVADIWNTTLKWLAIGITSFIALMLIGVGTYYIIIKKDEIPLS